MSRKQEVVVVPQFAGTSNRDVGQAFLITEWPATRAESWGLRMMFAFNKSSGQIPLSMTGLGMEGIAILGINTFLRGSMEPETIIPLLDELLECVRIIRDPTVRDHMTGEPVATPIVVDDDIKEVATRLWLKSEVVRVHTGFSPAEALLKLASAIMTRQDS